MRPEDAAAGSGQRRQDHAGKEAGIWRKQSGAVVATREEEREGQSRLMRRDFMISVGGCQRSPGELELDGEQGPPVKWPQETAAKSSLSGS